MEINLEEMGKAVLRLKGRLDATSAKAFRAEVEGLVEKDRVRLVVHLAAVDFIDSSGLGALVADLRSVNRRGGDIKVAALQTAVRSVFELTRLDRIFDILDDVPAAVRSFDREGQEEASRS
ncbi:MAG: anti-anti-sigma factor [Deltaproteobacteria bacterium]|nr:MAG: anti-anti-sigma factor [Deltaproteobacteria bacterium]